MVSKSPAETVRIGRVIGSGLRSGDCVALTGELGAGKTCLTQGIAGGMGVPASYVVASPTFTLINEYPGRAAILYHLDLYRLSGPGDLEEIGYREYRESGGVLVVEWADRIPQAIPEEAIRVTLSYLGLKARRVQISGDAGRIRSWSRKVTPQQDR